MILFAGRSRSKNRSTRERVDSHWTQGLVKIGLPLMGSGLYSIYFLAQFRQFLMECASNVEKFPLTTLGSAHHHWSSWNTFLWVRHTSEVKVP